MSKVNKDYVCSSFRDIDYSDLRCPIITVFDHPVDYPKVFVGRVFDLNVPTNAVVFRNTLEDMRDDIRRSGGYGCLDRNVHDAPAIVETWFMS